MTSSNIPEGTIFTGSIGTYKHGLFLKADDIAFPLSEDATFDLKAALLLARRGAVWSSGATVDNYQPLDGAAVRLVRETVMPDPVATKRQSMTAAEEW
jgi:hypothetical protein